MKLACYFLISIYKYFFYKHVHVWCNPKVANKQTLNIKFLCLSDSLVSISFQSCPTYDDLFKAHGQPSFVAYLYSRS